MGRAVPDAPRSDHDFLVLALREGFVPRLIDALRHDPDAILDGLSTRGLEGLICPSHDRHPCERDRHPRWRNLVPTAAAGQSGRCPYTWSPERDGRASTFRLRSPQPLLDSRPFERSPEGEDERPYRDRTAPPTARTQAFHGRPRRRLPRHTASR